MEFFLDAENARRVHGRAESAGMYRQLPDLDILVLGLRTYTQKQ